MLLRRLSSGLSRRTRPCAAAAVSAGRCSSTSLESSKAEPAEISVSPPTIENKHTSLTPQAIVNELDKYIIGQAKAKRAVAIALRNRWRRQMLTDEQKAEVIPKNILMIGPTGCGKTEIARRLSKLSQAPFIKVEATKFTEVGFHGRDVDQIIRDLVEISINLTKKRRAAELQPEAARLAENRILETLAGANAIQQTQSSFRDMLRKGILDDRQIDVDVPADKASANPNFVALDQAQTTTISFNEFIGRLGGANKPRTERKRMAIRDARPLLEEQELEKLMDSVDVQKEAVAAVEESGIVFIDEIDKICNSGDYRGADASAEGVQRDLLPLIEGSCISTKYGNVTPGVGEGSRGREGPPFGRRARGASSDWCTSRPSV